MTIRFSKPFVKQYHKLPEAIQKKVDRTIELMEENLNHPSLKVHKMVNSRDIYEGRVDIHHRVTFEIDNKTVIMRKVGTHEIYRNP